MAIVQCENNHYYDNKRNTYCPYCAKMNKSPVLSDDVGEKLTSYMVAPEEDNNIQLTEVYGDNVHEYDRTVIAFEDEQLNQFTVGWLVCTDGLLKGKSYQIHTGRNFAGRCSDMDIVLAGDMTIAREKHFSVVYDPKSIDFYLVAGNGQTYINGSALSAECVIGDGDEVSAGNTKYIFVPFCKEGRAWD